jgi:hypothetical protein
VTGEGRDRQIGHRWSEGRWRTPFSPPLYCSTGKGKVRAWIGGSCVCWASSKLRKKKPG